MVRVIKAEQAEGWPRRRIAAEVWQAGERAAAVLASAEAEILALRREAELERTAARAAAEEAGRAAGLAQGLASAAATLVRAAAERDAWLEAARAEALDLAVEMARRLLGRELRADPAVVQAAVEEALAAARGRRRLLVRLHPAAAGALSAAGDASLAWPGVELLADPALEPGDVVVETEAGSVDGRVATRLAEFRRALAEAGEAAKVAVALTGVVAPLEVAA